MCKRQECDKCLSRECQETFCHDRQLFLLSSLFDYKKPNTCRPLGKRKYNVTWDLDIRLVEYFTYPNVSLIFTRIYFCCFHRLDNRKWTVFVSRLCHCWLTGKEEAMKSAQNFCTMPYPSQKLLFISHQWKTFAITPLSLLFTNQLRFDRSMIIKTWISWMFQFRYLLALGKSSNDELFCAWVCWITDFKGCIMLYA